MRRTLRAALLVTLTLVTLGAAGSWWLHQEMTRMMQTVSVADGTQQRLRVAPGTSFRSLARQLEAEGWVANRQLFALAARLGGEAQRIKAGTYEIRGGDSPRSILERLVAGDTLKHRLTVVEGSTFDQLRAAISRAPGVSVTLADATGDTIMAMLGRPDVHPEGQFFPSTYHYEDGASDLALLERMHQRLQHELVEAWQARTDELPYETPYDALIMASIIEKETGQADERATIAGVFVRRLRRGMKLQTDPTVIYGLGQAFDGDLRRRDLRADTPYNTYTRHGLPPTPIALPGRAALDAAVNPAPGSSLYFVARGDGSHHFSETLAEHNRAVRRYQLKR